MILGLCPVILVENSTAAHFYLQHTLKGLCACEFLHTLNRYVSYARTKLWLPSSHTQMRFKSWFGPALKVSVTAWALPRGSRHSGAFPVISLPHWD